MAETCTWVNCAEPARHELRGHDGRQWANVCDAHEAEMEAAVNSPQVGDIVRCWIKAQGGAKAAAAAMAGSGFAYTRIAVPLKPGCFDRGHKRG